MPWIAAVLLDVGFSGRVSWVEKANFDRSSEGAPLTPKYVSTTASLRSAGVMPMAASALAASSPAANSRNFLAAPTLALSMPALI
jgi:hypothetical protein